jgi:hypothetical protein
MCNEYCGDYLTFVGTYYEYVKSNPTEFMDKYVEPQPPMSQYTLKTYRGIPITVKFNVWDEKLEVGPTITSVDLDKECGW